MPNLEIPQNEIEGEDIYPTDDEGRRAMLKWINTIYEIGEEAKSGYREKWEQYYKYYRSYVKDRAKGDWRSRVWIGISFYVIETITPRLVAQLPGFTVAPVGPEDAEGAKIMEELLKWASDKSGLYLELVKALKSALLYGTGILKTSYDEQEKFNIMQQPVMQQQTMEMPTGELDIDDQLIYEQVPIGEAPVMDPMTGQPQMQMVRTPYVSYAGPVAEAVDIADFYVDPIADSIETARWVIHRVYRDKTYLEEKFRDGTYKRPDEESWNTYLNRHSQLERTGSIGLGVGNTSAQYDKDVYELLEVWTPTTVMAALAAGSDATILLRAERNPFGHSEIPFVRIVDHLVPHEFWGIGELEPLEGMQKTINRLWNDRLDNVKLVLNTMFLASLEYIEDPGSLVARPGNVIKVKEGAPGSLDQIVKPLQLGEVTSSSYTEVAEVERMTEKISGVSPYQTGTDSASVNRTATGVALISEQGNTRFAHKVRIAELTGFRRLAEQYASIIQQFSPPQVTMRILNEIGEYQFRMIPADAIGGRYDFDVEAESSSQTESIRREQTLSLFQMLAADPYMKPLKLRSDVLETFGRKNVQDYMFTEEELMMMQANQAMIGGGEEAAAESGPPAGDVGA